MKTAEQWSDELNGETSPQAIRAIQYDAIAHALALLTRGHFSGRDAIVHELDVLTRKPNVPVSSGAASAGTVGGVVLP